VRENRKRTCEGPAREQPGWPTSGRVGRFVLKEVLGQGSMGVVYRAEDPQLGRDVALKVLRPEVIDEQDRLRLRREVRTLAGINHANLAGVREIGEEDGMSFLVMELLRGETLRDRLRCNRPLDLKEVVRIGQEVAEGLTALHNRGLVHRDLKPGNLFLEEDSGQVKILDYGLVKPLAALDDLAPSRLEGAVGTPGYMAPEQASCHPVDPRSDLFSVGCVLYRLCTGRLPFATAKPINWRSPRTIAAPEPPHLLNHGVPLKLSQLVMKLLAIRPEERFPSARVLAAALAQLAHPGEADLLPAAWCPPSPVSDPGTNGSITEQVINLKAGNQEAVRRLWERYFLLMVQVARKMLCSVPRLLADEEDVVQEAFLSFCAGAERGHFPELQRRHDLWRLLMTLTQRRAMTLLRREHREKRGAGRVTECSTVATLMLEQTTDPAPPPEQAAQFTEELARLFRALPEDLQAVAKLKMEGYTNQEIAQRLGCSERTVERRIRMIRAHWRKELVP
jgi:RNA polymerase sigma factor (sigma-70 family)